MTVTIVVLAVALPTGMDAETICGLVVDTLNDRTLRQLPQGVCEMGCAPARIKLNRATKFCGSECFFDLMLTI